MVDGTVPTGPDAGVDGFVGAGLALGAGVCGTPEPGLGVAGLVAGLFCAQPRAAQSRNEAILRIGERCIEFQGLPLETAKI